MSESVARPTELAEQRGGSARGLMSAAGGGPGRLNNGGLAEATPSDPQQEVPQP
jgi:hypothetical protein